MGFHLFSAFLPMFRVDALPPSNTMPQIAANTSAFLELA
jgi:hypothetical protein